MTEISDVDVVVIGGGHAGCEAASASARSGAKTLLFALGGIDSAGILSCNPAIGGIGKGHLTREIDALDGLMGRVADESGIHFRVLNASKGAAVRGPRAQVDRDLYRAAMGEALRAIDNLSVADGEVSDVIIGTDGVTGVTLADGREISCRSAAICTGTFLRGSIHVGERSFSAGRLGERATSALAKRLDSLGFETFRLKTGTPPRLDRDSIDFGSLERQDGDDPPQPFSSMSERIPSRQIPCFLGDTNERTHETVKRNLERSPMYSGAIESRGPRYCPSFEDKVRKFSDRTSHRVFFEPEGLESRLVYPNGLSTALPESVQLEMVRSVAGLERAKIVRYGYAIEYDCVDARALRPTLESERTRGLFLAGQINGTTGYEEAAAQGLVAGVNAAARALSAAPFELDRSQAYIGVMIDDLTSKGVSEPYRMFTSRAEYRLSLRADTAERRLTPLGIERGLVGAERRKGFERRRRSLESDRRRLESATLTSDEARRLGVSVSADGRRRSAFSLLSHPGVDVATLSRGRREFSVISPRNASVLEADAKYEVYLSRQRADAEAARRDEGLRLPPGIRYERVGGLSSEARARLEAARPATLGQASRLEGVTAAALTALLHHARRDSART